MATIAQKVSKQRTAPGAVQEYTIDAAGRTIGRVASEAASILLGKKSPKYVKNAVMPVKVTITNVSKLRIAEKKVGEKVYLRYTGYPGGLYSTKLSELITKKGVGEALKYAVDGMIPRNKLRKDRMKRLIITD